MSSAESFSGSACSFNNKILPKQMKNSLIMGVVYLLINTSLFAQSGSISGTIVNQETGETMVGAHVVLAENNVAKATNELGKFQFKNLEAGNYTLTVSFIGFTKISQSVTVKNGAISSLNISLKPDVLSIQDVEVTQDLGQNVSTISEVDIQLRPIETSQDVLEIVPGLFIAQHAGGGKAEQIFLRGFDIDHGTDISLSVDGMPVNMVSHAHGQGYSDLHFVIPETIERVDFDKGPYYTDHGNLNTAGYADFYTKKRLANNYLKLEGGQFGTFRTVGMFDLLKGKTVEDPSLYLATEFFRTDGYFDSPQYFTRLNTLLKYHQKVSRNQTLELSASTFTSSWDASGQIPVRAVESGMITRFGAIDDTEGGQTSRTNLNAKLITETNDGGLVENQFYFSNYEFELVSNFTFYLEDPVNGDQITQTENRQIYGSKNSYWNDWSLFGLNASTEIGAGFRYDQVNDIRLSHTLARREVLDDLAKGDVRETNIFAYAEEQLSLSKKLSLTAGLRFDYFTFDYVDALTTNYERQVEDKGIVSPKLQLSYQATENVNLYVKSGIGFHSNDTRVVVAQNGQEILPKAYGIDIGTFWKPTRNLLINLAAWRLDLDQEFVYVGDAGIVETGGKTQRQGIDLSLRYQLTKWLYLNADANYTDPKSVDEAEGEDYIPLAPTFTSVGGLNFQTENGFSGSLRYRYLGDRAANEDNSVIAEGYTVVDAVLNYQVGAFDFGVYIQNLLNEEWNEAQFDTESRLQNEAVPVSEIHFTPGTPFQARFSIGMRF